MVMLKRAEPEKCTEGLLGLLYIFSFFFACPEVIMSYYDFGKHFGSTSENWQSPINRTADTVSLIYKEQAFPIPIFSM